MQNLNIEEQVHSDCDGTRFPFGTMRLTNEMEEGKVLPVGTIFGKKLPNVLLGVCWKNCCFCVQRSSTIGLRIQIMDFFCGLTIIMVKRIYFMHAGAGLKV